MCYYWFFFFYSYAIIYFTNNCTMIHNIILIYNSRYLKINFRIKAKFKCILFQYDNIFLESRRLGINDLIIIIKYTEHNSIIILSYIFNYNI